MVNPNCAHCGSDDVRSFRALYETGTIPTMGNRVRYGSIAAMDAAPPRRQRLGWPITLLIVSLLIWVLLQGQKHPNPSASLVLLLVAGVFVVAIIVTMLQNKFVWTPKYWRWCRMYRCMRCGRSMEIAT